MTWKPPTSRRPRWMPRFVFQRLHLRELKIATTFIGIYGQMEDALWIADVLSSGPVTEPDPFDLMLERFRQLRAWWEQ